MDWDGAATFHDSLASLLRAGMTQAQAIATAGLAARGEHRARAPGWSAACASGLPLSEAMRQDGMPAVEVALVSAGERGGRLPDLCQLLAGHFRHFSTLRRQLLGRLAYPVFLIHLALMVLAVPYVVPRLLSGEPVSLIWFIAGPLTLWAVAFLVWLLVRRLGPLGRARVLALPGLAACNEAWTVVNTCAVLRAACGAGMLVPQALELAAEACGDHPIAARLRRQAKQALTAGTPLSTALGQAGLPGEVIARLGVAETAGTVEEALERLTLEWREHFERRLAWLSKTISGAVYGLAMLVVAATVIALFMRFYLDPLHDAMRNAEG